MNLKTTTSVLVLAAVASFAGASGAPQDKTAYDWLAGNDKYSKFVMLIDKADMKDAWNNENMRFTIFAPMNSAFDRVPQDKLDMIMNDSEKAKMLVKYHMVGGAKYGLTDLRTRNSLSMSRRADGKASMVSITEEGAFVKVNEAFITDPEHWVGMGVVHGINRVLMPMNW